MSYRKELKSGGYRVGETNVAVLPIRRRSSIPVVFAHGGGGTYAQWNDAGPAILPALVAQAGLVCLCSDLGGLNPWGNPDMAGPGTNATDQLITWSATNYGTRTDKVALVGLSHGASDLNWAWRNTGKVAAFLAVLPGVDMQGLYERDPLGLVVPQMNAAYGSPAGVVAAYPTRDPAHPDNVALEQPIADRIAVWYGLDDTITLPAEVAGWADAVGVPDDQVHAMAGVGHDFDFDWRPLVDWLVPTVRHTP